MFLQTKTSRTKKIGINDLQKDWKRNGMFDQKTLGKGEWALFYQKLINQKKADKLASKMINETKQMGNNVLAPPILHEVRPASEKGWESAIEDMAKKHKLKAVVAIIPITVSSDARKKARS
eukprot:UN13240